MATTEYEVQPSAFPAQSKTASAEVNGTPTTVTSTSFADKLLLTIAFAPSSWPSRAGTLAHWIHVPLATSSSTLQDPSVVARSGGEDLLPRTDLTATTVLGGTKREDEAVGQTLATMLASQILVKRPSEERMLVLGLGPISLAGSGSQALGDLVGLCLGVLLAIPGRFDLIIILHLEEHSKMHSKDFRDPRLSDGSECLAGDGQSHIERKQFKKLVQKKDGNRRSAGFRT